MSPPFLTAEEMAMIARRNYRRRAWDNFRDGFARGVGFFCAIIAGLALMQIMQWAT